MPRPVIGGVFHEKLLISVLDIEMISHYVDYVEFTRIVNFTSYICILCDVKGVYSIGIFSDSGIISKSSVIQHRKLDSTKNDDQYDVSLCL